MKFSKTAWLKAFSGLSVNLSAAWFGAVLVFPNFSSINNYADALYCFTIWCLVHCS